MAQLPHSYFRYVAPRGDVAWNKLEQTICRSELPTARAESFNDPFEVGPVLFGDRSRPVLVDGKYGAITIWSADVSKLWNELSGKVYDIDDLLRSYVAHFSLVSLSRRLNSGLLWSHYAEGYRGIALHFTPSNHLSSPFKDSKFQWISYQKQRPMLSIDSLRYYFDSTLVHQFGSFAPEAVSAIELQLIGALFLGKSEEWAYEEEARLIFSGAPEAVAFPPEELTSVILGPRCPEDTVIRVKELASRRKIPLRVLQAKLSATDYSVEVDWSGK